MNFLLDRGPLLRGLALFSCGLALALYGWGLLHLLGAVLDAEDGGANSSPVRPCLTARSGVEPVDYRADYVPLRFVCETKDGGSYVTDDVPGYVNPGAFGFVLAGALLAVGAGYEAELRARRAAAAPVDGKPGPTS
ncbi:hypothetical protein ACH4TV_07185 [Streptomyces sp. NPDC020898]|uniref:hypothetical protein n=1 Tax=Streptomyces sp. NPDC020898 TaxID=3365101 RepID=UPI0037B5F30E